MSDENQTDNQGLRAMLDVLFDSNPDGVAYSDAKGVLSMNTSAAQWCVPL